MLRLFKIVRAQDWWSHKTPLILGAAYVSQLITQAPVYAFSFNLLHILWYVIALGSFGYLLNDFTDMEQDALAGKSNQMRKIPAQWRLPILMATGVIGFASIALISTPLEMTIAGLNYALPMLYSIRPIRMKERGIWGPLLDALAANVLPGIFAVVHVFRDSDQSSLHLLILVFILYSSIGFRGILIHMLSDRANDQESNTSTFIFQISDLDLNRLIKVMILAEVILFIQLAQLTKAVSPLLLVGLVLFTTITLIKFLLRWNWVYREKNQAILSFRYPAPDTTFFQVWMPVLCLIALAATNASLIALLILHLALFPRAIASQVKDSGILVTIFMDKLKQTWKALVLSGNVFRWNLYPDLTNPVILEMSKSKKAPRSVYIEIPDHPGDLWSIKLRYWSLKLWFMRLRDTRGEDSFTLEFRIRSDSTNTGTIVFGCWQDKDPWDNLGLFEEIKPTTDWQSFEFRVFLHMLNKPYYLGFWLGDVAGRSIHISAPKISTPN